MEEKSAEKRIYTYIEEEPRLGVESFSQGCLAITEDHILLPAAFPISFQRG